MDEDDYPTQKELAKIQEWHWSDFLGLMAYIKERWYLSSWGWREEDWNENWPCGDREQDRKRFLLSTAGWSGNEDIVEALQQNRMFWSMCWFTSQRGGHYDFRVKDFK
jgi:hypothetical protein